MKIKKIDHIGIAVNTLNEALPVFEKVFNMDCNKRETVTSEGVETAFFVLGETKIELLQPITDKSALKKSLNKRGQGMHHIAIQVENIEEEMERLSREGFTLLSETPKKGANNKLVCFIHPKDTCGVLIELCQG